MVINVLSSVLIQIAKNQDSYVKKESTIADNVDSSIKIAKKCHGPN